ncbi:hypothetical protein V1478_010268 [Vespula squamosa]|uniref:Uncharacterized protein n=1 Tax=Vespula squamosa TaxID=30214 RepID=A0ABD2AJ87_VESSQ
MLHLLLYIRAYAGRTKSWIKRLFCPRCNIKRYIDKFISVIANQTDEDYHHDFYDDMLAN